MQFTHYSCGDWTILDLWNLLIILGFRPLVVGGARLRLREISILFDGWIVSDSRLHGGGGALDHWML